VVSGEVPLLRGGEQLGQKVGLTVGAPLGQVGEGCGAGGAALPLAVLPVEAGWPPEAGGGDGPVVWRVLGPCNN
jgi:hypothetical protein